MMNKKNSLFCYFCAISLLFVPFAVKGHTADAYKLPLHHAQTYYWLGIQDKGDPGAFELALMYLRQAQEELQLAEQHIDDEEKESLYKQIELLESDLKEQLAIAQNTFVGRFPLVRFMGPSFFVSSKALGSFEIFEDAGEVAMARSADKLGGLFYNHFFGELQLPLIVFSQDNLSPELESKVRVTLKKSPRIKVYQTQYLRKYLIEDELHKLQKGSPDSLLIAKVSNILNAENFAITLVKQLDQAEDVHFFSLSTRVFSIQSAAPLQSTVLYELVRDKRYLNPLYLLLILAMLILSILVYLINYKSHTGKYPLLGKNVAVVVFSFFIGYIITIIALGVFANLRPNYLDYFGYTFWWIPAAMLIIFIAPLLILKKYILSLSFFQSAEDSSSRLSPLFMAASLGVLANLSLGLILYHEILGLLYVFAGMVSIGIAAFIAGKVISTLKPLPPAFGVLAVLIIPIAGLALASNNVNYMLIPVLSSTSLLLASQLKSVKTKGIAAKKPREVKKTVSVQVLINLTESPPYIKTKNYAAARDKTDIYARGHAVIYCLSGEEGTGKTAMAHQLIAEFSTLNNKQNKPILLLDAQCLENNDAPYWPVQNALADFINFLGKDSNGHESMEDVEDALDKLIGSFVPFSSLLKPANQSRAAGINSQSELFYMITKTLEKLSQQYHLIFFIDDLHWADSATLDLLHAIHQQFRNSSSKQALFLYTTRPSEACSNLFLDQEVQTLDVLSRKEKLALLTGPMGLESETAGFILDRIGDQNRKGNLFLLYKIIEQLAREGHLNEKINGISLSDEILQKGKLPIPDEYKESLRQELSKLDRYEEYIAVAACMGMEFEVGVMAHSLGVDRLKCLKVLQYLENETSILADKPEKDDVFSFTSSFTLETIREIYALTDQGPEELVKQIVREYHARIAISLEQKDADGNVLSIASHYYAAGQHYAETALRFLIKAADRCADIFRFEEARMFLRKAAIEKKYAKDEKICELDILLVECKISMLEGKHFDPIAKKCHQFLSYNSEINDNQKIIFARAFYNARIFDDAVALLKDIISNSKDDYVLARAYHLLGISLSPDLSSERHQYLKMAMNIADKLPDHNTVILKAKSEIHNSMGEELTKAATKEPTKKELAEQHFKESIRIKQMKEISDTPGLARTYGGLGRLEMYAQPANIQKALEYFTKDLELSEQIGDILGQTQMHSNIGKCHILLGQFDKAGVAYQRSLDLAERQTDKAFALLGLLQISDQNDGLVAREEIAGKMIEIITQADFIIPKFLKDEINRFLINARNKTSLDEIEKLIN